MRIRCVPKGVSINHGTILKGERAVRGSVDARLLSMTKLGLGRARPAYIERSFVDPTTLAIELA